jgi:hypothetical protein
MRDLPASTHEPHNWSQAFAALPLEAPDSSVWPAIAPHRGTTLKTRRPQVRWAVAAALALAIAMPAAWLHDRQAAQPHATLAEARGAKPSADTASSRLAAAATEATTGPTPAMPVKSLDASPEPRPLPKTSAPRVAAAAAPPAGSDEAPATMPALYAQSAQLEAMLAQVRDERVSSGPAAALALQYEAELALIDAELANVALHDAERPLLWRDRVGALQRLVDFESTQRWLTAQGERYDGQLVAVY